jgi:hypothetical protein
MAIGYWNKTKCKYGKLKRPNYHGQVCRKRPKKGQSKKRCRYGVNKKTKMCLKHPRKRR